MPEEERGRIIPFSRGEEIKQERQQQLAAQKEALSKKIIEIQEKRERLIGLSERYAQIDPEKSDRLHAVVDMIDELVGKIADVIGEDKEVPEDMLRRFLDTEVPDLE